MVKLKLNKINYKILSFLMNREITSMNSFIRFFMEKLQHRGLVINLRILANLFNQLFLIV